MKRTLYTFFKTALGGICLFMLAFSCVEEGADCPADITLCFTYTFNEQQTDLFDQEVNELMLYVFDSHDRLHDHLSIEVHTLGPSNTYTCQLAEGKYRIVALGNLDQDSFQLDNNTPTMTTTLAIVTDTRGEAQSTISDLFYGTADFSARLNTTQTVDIPMVKNTNNISVLIPDPSTRTIPGSDIQVRISGSNGAVDLENNSVARYIIYKPQYSKTTYNDQQHHRAAFKVFKLTIGDDTAIRLSRSDTVLREDNLVQLLTTHFPHIQTDQDLLRYSDYMFVYDYDHNGTLVLGSITAGPWTITVNQQGGL